MPWVSNSGQTSTGQLFINVFLGGLIMLAIWRVVLSKNSQTPKIINNSGSAITSTLNAASGNAA